jgi:hypothetical protein
MVMRTGKPLDTFPGFQQPLAPVRFDEILQDAPKPRMVTLSSGLAVPLPLRFWEARALFLIGFADAEALDRELAPYGRQALRIERPFDGDGKGSAGMVQIYVPDYEGTSIGPIKAAAAQIFLKPLAKDWRPHLLWWWYYGNSPTNQKFKEEIWRIPNRLAPVETAYAGNVKAARVLGGGRPILRMLWDAGRLPDSREVRFPRVTFLSVSPGRDRRARLEVEVAFDGAKIEPPVGHEGFPFNPATDRFETDPSEPPGRALAAISFQPHYWSFFTSFSGVVKLHDRLGSSEPERGARSARTSVRIRR